MLFYSILSQKLTWVPLLESKYFLVIFPTSSLFHTTNDLFFYPGKYATHNHIYMWLRITSREIRNLVFPGVKKKAHNFYEYFRELNTKSWNLLASLEKLLFGKIIVNEEDKVM